jgi:hypothetical protein
MTYNPSLIQKVQKYEAFFRDKEPGSILAYIYRYDLKNRDSFTQDPARKLNEWDFSTENNLFVERMVRGLRAYLAFTRDIDDDFIPWLSPGLGIALYSAWFSNADIIFGAETSWTHPVINDWCDLDKLVLDPENRWLKYIIDTTELLMHMNEGDYFVQPLSHLSPLDMANAIRGNQIFYDFYDAPDQVRLLLNTCTEAIIWLQNKMRGLVDPGLGGSDIWGAWIPGHNVFMSEDVADLCSDDLYRSFARPCTQRVCDSFDGCFIHHHAKGFHVHQSITQLSQLKLVEISWDPNTPRPIDRIASLYEMNADIPLMTRCTAQDVYEKIDEIKKGRAILMLSVDNLDEGKDVLRFIRKHSKL